MFQSFTPPHTTAGRSALVSPPPWHYAGWLLNVAFEFEAALGALLVPPQLGTCLGTGCVHFAEWQAVTDGRELLDPVLSQYRETIVVVDLLRPDGSRCAYCPAIWVDQDVALLRGLLQGWPKKLGSTHLTRSLPLDHPAAAPLQAGVRLGASLCVKDRRLMDAEWRLSGKAAPPLGFLASPTLGAAGLPDLRRPAEPTTTHLLRSHTEGIVSPGWHAASASLSWHAHPQEELSLLGPVRATSGSAGWLGLTVLGALDA